MAQRSGSADLPLHGGRVPPWLAERMARLGAVISEAVVLEYGRDELMRRLAHPFWFQAFGAVMGMDWHSSGITTSVIGALKRGLAPLVERARASTSAAGAASIRARRRPSSSPSADRTGLDGAALGAGEPARGQGRLRRRPGRLRALPARLLRHRRRPVDRRAAGHERRGGPGAALPLAVGGADELRRRAARGDRRPGAGRHRQPGRPPRRGVARAPAGPSGHARAGRGGQRACSHRAAGAGRGGPAARAPAPGHARAPRRPAGRRHRSPPARRPGRRGRPGAEGLRRPAAGPGRRRADSGIAGAGRGGRARRALPLLRPGAVRATPTGARTAIPSRSRSTSTTRPFVC